MEGQQQFHAVSSNGNDFERSWIYKAVSYFILELKDPSQTKSDNRRITENKKYTVLSQQKVLDIVITFIRKLFRDY